MTPALFIAWRSGDRDAGRWGPVGRLEHSPVGYRFVYTRGARMLDGFHPFPGMPYLDEVYESVELFPLFANRLLARSRPEYEAFLTWSGFDPTLPPDPLAVLAVTEGRRQTDAYEVFPCPMPDDGGCYSARFFLHGIRWTADDARVRIDRLQPSERLGVMLDVSNKRDPFAVAVRTDDTRDNRMIGYVPRYLARDIRVLTSRCPSGAVELNVVRVNPSAPLQQRLLCSLRACWPEGFNPCDSEEFQSMVSHSETAVEQRESRD